MKVKPKEVLLNLPIVLMFNEANEIPMFAEQINTIINGKIKIKYEELGQLNEQFVAIFYLNRHDEYAELRESFVEMIEKEEIEAHNRAVKREQFVRPERNAMFCEHTNEVPMTCSCPNDCFCKNHTCKFRAAEAR